MSQDARLGLVLGINLAMVLGLLTVGLLARSLGVLAAGADYLGDALGAGLSLAAVKVSRRPRGPSKAGAAAALFNSSVLLLVTLAVGIDAIVRLAGRAPAVRGVPVVVVSVIAAAAMIACAFILGDVDGDLNMQSVMLDTVADAAAALGVAISGGLILITNGTFWLDPTVAMAIALVVAYHALRLMRSALAELGKTRQHA